MNLQKILSRRAFIGKCGIVMSGFSLLPSLSKASDVMPCRIRRSNPFIYRGKPIVVTVEGTDFDSMIIKALELLGGLEKLIKRDDRIMIKPNFVSSAPYPETTHPESVLRIVELLRKVNKKRPAIVESMTAGGHNPEESYQQFGLQEQANQKNIELLGFNSWDATSWQFVADPAWKRLKKVPTFEPILKTDILINMPTLKRHGFSHFTCALKNMVGCIGMQGRGALHFKGVFGPPPENRLEAAQENIAEIAHIFDPDLTIIDARKTMLEAHTYKGGGEVIDTNLIVVSGNVLAADLIAAEILDQFDPTFENEMVTAGFRYMATLINGPNSVEDIHQIKAKV